MTSEIADQAAVGIQDREAPKGLADPGRTVQRDATKTETGTYLLTTL